MEKITPKTANSFKRGDKVYIYPGKCNHFTHYIRATVVDVDDKGYLLKSFQQDLPGIWTFNVWDIDLIPRTSKAKRIVDHSKHTGSTWDWY